MRCSTGSSGCSRAELIALARRDRLRSTTCRRRSSASRSASSPAARAYVPMAHDYAGAPEQLARDSGARRRCKPLLESEQPPKIGHDLKYATHVLKRTGIELRGMRFDSMLESYVWNSTATRHDVDAVARKYLGVDPMQLRRPDRPRREADRLQPGRRSTRRRSTPPSTPTSSLQLHARAVAEASPACRRCARCTRRSSSRSCPCCCAWSRPAC